MGPDRDRGFPQIHRRQLNFSDNKEQGMRLAVAFVIALGVLPLAGAAGQEDLYEKLSWEPPSKELLAQKYCPLDSAADAMVVQKETQFFFDFPALDVTVRRRVKIYTDQGLSHAEFKEDYGTGYKIMSIEAKSYDINGQVTELDKKDIHDEILFKSEKGDYERALKSFAIPNVSAGCVIDVTVKKSYLVRLTPPIFRFQEDIPVAFARFRMNTPTFLTYSYTITNRDLIDPKPYFHDKDFYCDARDVPAIEKEIYCLPKRNLVTDLWVNWKGVRIYGETIDLAGTWRDLLAPLKKEYRTSFESSKKAHKLADSLMEVTADTNSRIKLAYDVVRDRWDNYPLFGVHGPPYELNDLFKRKSLDPEEKATALWAVLKYMGVESEVVWVCSDNSDYSPMSDVPSLRMFDYALTWIPSDSLFLDPGDEGGKDGILDEALSERLMCRPMSDSILIAITPKIERTSGILIDLKLSLTESGAITGRGLVTYHGQDAIKARRIFCKRGTEESRSGLNRLLFRNDKDAVKSFALAPDSVQTPEMFQVTCDLDMEGFFDPTETDFDLAVFPGPTFETTTLDYNPPRKYPIYFDSKERYVYTVEWDFGDSYRPASTEGLNLAVNVTLLDYKLLTDYDSTQNILKVRRQYNRTQKLFQPRFTPSFERFLQESKKCDLSTIPVVKN
jgi:hypothetical protein